MCVTVINCIQKTSQNCTSINIPTRVCVCMHQVRVILHVYMRFGLLYYCNFTTTSMQVIKKKKKVTFFLKAVDYGSSSR